MHIEHCVSPYYILPLSEFSRPLMGAAVIAPAATLASCPHGAADHTFKSIAKMAWCAMIKDKDEVMITADAEYHNSLDIIMRGRRRAWRERKLLALMILNDNGIYSHTVNKTKLNLLMMQKNAAVGGGVRCFDKCFPLFQLKFWISCFKMILPIIV